MIVCTARKRPVPRKRAMPSANWPTASGLSRSKLVNPRLRPRGTSSRGVSATACPLAPVVGQQVVEDVVDADRPDQPAVVVDQDRKSTRLNSSHANISYAVFCLKKK